MLERMRSAAETPYIPLGRSGENGRRRNFGVADKRRIVEEACGAGASVSGVAKKYGIGARLLFQWKKDLMPEPAPVFAEVKLGDVAVPATMPSASPAPPVVVERVASSIEVG